MYGCRVLLGRTRSRSSPGEMLLLSVVLIVFVKQFNDRAPFPAKGRRFLPGARIVCATTQRKRQKESHRRTNTSGSNRKRKRHHGRPSATCFFSPRERHLCISCVSLRILVSSICSLSSPQGAYIVSGTKFCGKEHSLQRVPARIHLQRADR